MAKLIIGVDREGYEPEQVQQTMTVGELISMLEDYDPNMPVYAGHDMQRDGSWYTYGGFHYSGFYEVEDEEEEE